MKNFFKNKNNIIIGLCAVVLLMGIGFAAFSQRLQIGDTTVTNSDWNVYIKSAVTGTPVGGATGSAQVVDRASAKLTANLQSPGDSVTYTITVANDGNIDAVLDLITLSASNSDSVIKYSYAGITEDEELLAQTETSFTVKIEYDSTKTGTVTEAQKQNTLTLDLDYVQKTSGGGSSSGGTSAATMLASKAVTTGDGLYADTYESGRYVYKGAAPENYITFNGEEAGWRIMSVEADGTIKIIRKFILESRAFDSEGLRDSSSNGAGGTYCAGSSNGCNAWAATANLVGTPAEFTNAGKTGTVLLDAELNTYLNTTYLNSIDTTFVVSHDFGVGPTKGSYDDLAAQIASEQSYKWNGKIGLMNVSDYLRANTNTAQCETLILNNRYNETCRSTNYLFTTLGADFPLTINPDSGSTDYEYFVNNNGYMSTYVAFGSLCGVAPVLYLKSDISLSGEGKAGSPYEIVS